MKKIPWILLALQILYLATGTFFHMVVRHNFIQIFEGMGIPVEGINNLVLKTPLLIAGLCCSFLFFLWAWKYDRLENWLVVVFTNLPGLSWVIFHLYVIMAPRHTNGISQMG